MRTVSIGNQDAVADAKFVLVWPKFMLPINSPVLIRIFRQFLRLKNRLLSRFEKRSCVIPRRVPVGDNTAQECIGTVAPTYGCKILQPYEFNANVYGYDANCKWHPKNTSSCNIKDS